jgi:hypothetical protein
MKSQLIGNAIKNLKQSPYTEHSTKHRNMHHASKQTREIAAAILMPPFNLETPGRVTDHGTRPAMMRRAL